MERSQSYLYADGQRFMGKSPEMVFTEIAEQNLWMESESVSGFGSSLKQTAELVAQLPGIFQQFNVKKLLDVPCGDFNWMKTVDLKGIDYTGGDIVRAIVDKNNSTYQSDTRRFYKLDLLNDKLDGYDLLFCRDCLVHLSFEDVFKVLTNLKGSNVRYLMATTFPEEKNNQDVPTGGWRPLNFQAAPFHFPGPLFLLNEKCTEMDGMFGDKSMGLWEVKDLSIFAFQI